jgi:hypothetical protein
MEYWNVEDPIFSRVGFNKEVIHMLLY